MDPGVKGKVVRVCGAGRGREGTRVETVEGRWTAQVPAARLERAEDIPGTAAFVLSEAAGYVTGQKPVVDGGLVRAV